MNRAVTTDGPEATSRPDAVGRDRRVRRVLLVVLAANLLVAAIEATVGLYIGSLALVADAVHSLLDASSNVVGLVGVTIAARPPDRGHPYGHRRFESLASLVIGILIVVGLVEILQAAFESLLSQSPPPEVSWLSIAVLIPTIGFNFAVSRYERIQGQKLSSSLLTADSAHTMADAAGALVVVLSLTLVKLGWGFMDVVAAFVVSVFIARAAFRIIASNVGALADAACVNPTDIEELCLSIADVETVSGVRSRRVGDDVHVDLRVQLSGTMSLAQAHAVAHQVEDTVRAHMPEIVDVVVHTEPSDVDQNGTT